MMPERVRCTYADDELCRPETCRMAVGLAMTAHLLK